MRWQSQRNALAIAAACVGNRSGMRWRLQRLALAIAAACVGNRSGLRFLPHRSALLWHGSAWKAHMPPSAARRRIASHATCRARNPTCAGLPDTHPLHGNWTTGHWQGPMAPVLAGQRASRLEPMRLIFVKRQIAFLIRTTKYKSCNFVEQHVKPNCRNFAGDFETELSR